MDIIEMLIKLNLSQYESNFEKNNINGRNILKLNNIILN